MNDTTSVGTSRGKWIKCSSAERLLALLLVGLFFVGVPWASAQSAEARSFASPSEAAKALVSALEANNTAALSSLLGPEGDPLISSGDGLADQAERAKFVQAYHTKHALISSGANARVLRVGMNDWPLPIPVVRSLGRWRFDTLAGREELLFRRIGNNELGAIAVCKGYVSAQRDYASAERDGQPAGIYAQKIMSDPGKHNGLYWETKSDEPPSPAGPLVARASEEGYLADKTRPKLTPYHGYYYRIVKAQGAAAHSGAVDYFVDGRMVKGFALVAFPVQYQSSGVMTFIVNQEGVVYQSDLGHNTEEIASGLTEFNPDSSWSALKK